MTLISTDTMIFRKKNLPTNFNFSNSQFRYTDIIRRRRVPGFAVGFNISLNDGFIFHFKKIHKIHKKFIFNFDVQTNKLHYNKCSLKKKKKTDHNKIILQQKIKKKKTFATNGLCTQFILILWFFWNFCTI